MPRAAPIVPPRRRWWLRVSLRGLMVLVVLVGGGLGYLVRAAKVQRAAVVAVERAGGRVEYDWEHRATSGFQDDWLDWDAGRPAAPGEPWAPRWLVDRLGVDFFGRVVAVDFTSWPTDADLATVAGLPSLEVLDVGGPRVTDAGLAHLAGLGNLRVLTFGGGAVISSGRGWPSGPRLTAAGLGHLAGLDRLETLELDNVAVRDADLAALGSLRALRHLNLRETAVTDAGLAHLAALAGLESLDLDGDPITDAGLAHLRSLTKLRFLALEDTRITAAGVATLTGLADLRRLDLGGLGRDDVRQLDADAPGAADAVVSTLGRWPRLASLNLTGAAITDEAAAGLGRLPALTRLGLAGTAITDAGIDRLGDLGRFRSLFISDSQVTPGRVAALRRAYPKLFVYDQPLVTVLSPAAPPSPPSPPSPGAAP